MPYCQMCGDKKENNELKLYKRGINEVRLCVNCVKVCGDEIIPINGRNYSSTIHNACFKRK